MKIPSLSPTTESKMYRTKNMCDTGDGQNNIYKNTQYLFINKVLGPLFALKPASTRRGIDS